MGSGGGDRRLLRLLGGRYWPKTCSGRSLAAPGWDFCLRICLRLSERRRMADLRHVCNSVTLKLAHDRRRDETLIKCACNPYSVSAGGHKFHKSRRRGAVVDQILPHPSHHALDNAGTDTIATAHGRAQADRGMGDRQCRPPVVDRQPIRFRYHR